MVIFENFFTKITKGMDLIAGVCVFIIMVVVVANIILRSTINQPILGTYEIVSYLTATAIALSLAYCAIQNGHIAIDYIVNRLSHHFQRVLNIVINSFSFIFLSIISYQMMIFALSMKSNGIITANAQIPVFPFVFIIGIGFATLSIVYGIKVVSSLIKIPFSLPFAMPSFPLSLPAVSKRSSK
ncbi:hypothetical protein SYNTR_1814 [Candidatus Syntrophocurvum alkaliphilum]|uniref:Tripartite ATP-independent periplasmic transporters DctQ component domain-containing protein n=1 Tax=Candidatus Syntrophocurvum alkaliphilum TaxID=2293317 RepID=A0A6I6DN34_9FIRM|nr:TRAP transporter small permease [Candidatus Syntrophocurvum alkaliphilum]QGU00408.1 hypothetical protein SYNTR_1814 [Candidatus Syntrophocurvum alkaliphilum]